MATSSISGRVVLGRYRVVAPLARGGMGFGLSGSKRLVNEFEILSQVGVGTTVIIKKWENA